MIELRHVAEPGFALDEGSPLLLENYQVGSFEGKRLTSIEITLRFAQNTARDAALFVIKGAPQELLRNWFAHVVWFRELFHIPIGLAKFREIAAGVWDAFFHNKQFDWEAAYAALQQTSNSDWLIVDAALCRLLNASIARRLRTSSDDTTERMDTIESIDTIDDLQELNDPLSKFTVTHHAEYLSAFRTLVMRAFKNIFEPGFLIMPGDPNFGDFIGCEDVKFYHEGWSKYDFGTLPTRADDQILIGEMLKNHTVLRIPRAAILTNAVDLQLIRRVQSFRACDQAQLKSLSRNVGAALIDAMDFPRENEIISLLCIERGKAPQECLHEINLGRTLEGDLVFIR
jgi:hypothetical protein